MSKLVGYARVSTRDQDLSSQINELKKVGCKSKYIFTDKITGVRSKRPGLDNCLEILESGDTLVVWRIDRLGRSMSHLILLVEDLRSRGISFKSISDGAIDTTTASGELVFNIFSSLSQFERRLIQERTRIGLDAARARGRKGGRKPLDSKDPRILTAKQMHKDRSMTINDICKSLKISRATFYRFLKL
ncbi:recombinase family protein [Francisella sp. SYW-9]|uniref:recombinase family protein n=1 Tax=Francisella sp. SYW-9 TaxID=2610888 RepID=UPI00123DA43E|nr:recombinase family protein [Francisella sp. SYW-9]